MGEYEKSLTQLQIAFDGAEQFQDYGTGGLCLSNMGTIYSKTNKLGKAIAVDKQALEFIARDTSRDQTNFFITTNFNLFDLYLRTDSLDKARNIITVLREKVDVKNFKRAKGRLAIAEMKLLKKEDNCDRQIQLAEETIKEFKNIKTIDARIYWASLFHKAICLTDRNQFVEANKIAEEIFSFSKGTNPAHRSEIYSFVHDIYEHTGQFEKALDAHVKFKNIQDSFLNDEKNKRIAQLEALYELEKKEKTIKESENEKLILKQRNSWLIALASGLILLGGIYWFFVSQNRRREAEKMNQIEQKMLSLQMNPHFIFNAISSIQNYLFDEGDSKTAIRHLSTFATLMRQMLENSREKFIPLEEEISFLENYLNLQKLRFDDKFDFEIQVDSEIDPRRLSIPPLLTQPFAENAIEHGKIHLRENGKLEIYIKPIGEDISIEILDNGVGFKAKNQKERAGESLIFKKKSLSVSITKERLELLSKLMKKKFSLEISERLEEKGTAVNLKVPAVYL